MLDRLGDELRRSRASKGLSLEAVAGPAQISAAYLHKLERGVVENPSPRVLARIAASLGVSYLRLMDLAGYLDETQLAAVRLRSATSPKPHPLADQQLTPEEWRAVGAFIKNLLAERRTRARGGGRST
jgi:HTH-type transcriptional regulator, competence development regulator